MSGYVPKVGDRVRITYETTVIGTDDIAGHRGDRFTGADIKVGTLDGHSVWMDPDEDKTARRLISVERLPDPEPKWQRGDVGVCPCGDTYLRTRDGLWLNAAGTAGPGPGHALTLLVRDGKSVTA